ncbi:glycosyltransferase family 1 protein [Stipitochalara longipes BDJ]|nr:glycosyltransferase family 1 protein [Stipitochalara longipes BDJ]
MGTLRQAIVFSTIFAALLAVFITRQSRNEQAVSLSPLIRGRNQAVLFLALAESGQINVQLATAQALMEKHPKIEIHFASFPKVAEKVARVSSFALKKTSSAQEIMFHSLPGPDRIEAVQRQMNCSGPLECLAHPPGARGAAVLAQQIELALWSWSGEEHRAIYDRVIEITQQVDPAVVVVDYAFRPAIDATLKLNRLYLIISPLAMADLFGILQPYGGALWKYPSLGTGFSFPVPWYQIPENVYVTLRLAYNVFLNPATGASLSYLRENGIGSGGLFSSRPDVPFITQTLPEASIPLDLVPPNVTCAGAILLDSGSAEEQDPELVKWLQRSPTVVINLGSLFKYDEERARIMALAIRIVLEKTNVQFLWKVAKGSDFSDDFTRPLKEYSDQERVKIMDWLTIDTLPLLETGYVVASIHHGGSSSYNEAMAAGIPQVVIPLWEDHYNFAQLVEDLGLGIYATRGTAPNWTVNGLVDSFLKILDDSDVSAKIRQEAARIGHIARENPGRYVAAREIYKLIASGV